MDVVPDRDLYDFIEGAGGIENVNARDIDSSVSLSDDVAATDVWHLIANAVDNWSRKIIDAEGLHKRSDSLRTSLDDSIYRQELDGFLPTFELSELNATKDKFIRLLHALSSYSVGDRHTTVKKDIISMMLDLYELKKLTAQTFITCCAHL